MDFILHIVLIWGFGGKEPLELCPSCSRVSMVFCGDFVFASCLELRSISHKNTIWGTLGMRLLFGIQHYPTKCFKLPHILGLGRHYRHAAPTFRNCIVGGPESFLGMPESLATRLTPRNTRTIYGFVKLSLKVSLNFCLTKNSSW